MPLKDKAKRAAYNKMWQQKNRERRNAYVRRLRVENDEYRQRQNLASHEWYLSHSAEHRAYGKQWAVENAEKNRAYHQEYARAYYLENKPLIDANNREWRLHNPDRYRVLIARRRARKMGADGSHSAEDLAAIFKAQHGRCAYCTRKFTASLRKTIDHIVPLCRGGRNDRLNLQYLCRSCNSSKHAIDPIAYAQSIGLLI